MQYKRLKILKKIESSYLKDVYDLCVDNNHTYISENGIINHNSGIAFNSSITLMLSAAKLDGVDKENDKAANAGKSELTKTGVIVTATPQKSRFTIPQKVRFYIPFFKKPNPYIGIDQYMTWENSGIIRGKCYNQTQYDKLKPADQEICLPFEYNGEKMYAWPKDTAKTIVAAHLGGEFPITELFTPKIMTEEWLRKFDDEVIRPAFELPDQTKFDEDNEEYTEELITVDE